MIMESFLSDSEFLISCKLVIFRNLTSQKVSLTRIMSSYIYNEQNCLVSWKTPLKNNQSHHLRLQML